MCFRTLCVFGAPGVRPECPRPAGSARTDSRTPGTLVLFCDLFFGNLCALFLMVGQWDRLSRPPIPRVGTRLESARTGVNACACVFGAAFCCMAVLYEQADCNTSKRGPPQLQMYTSCRFRGKVPRTRRITPGHPDFSAPTSTLLMPR